MSVIPASSVYGKYPLRKVNKSLSVSMSPTVRRKVVIRDDLKAGGTLVKKMEVVLTPEGPKVNLIR